MRKRILIILLALILLFSLMVPAEAELLEGSENESSLSTDEKANDQLLPLDSATTEATIEVTYCQSDARSMLKMINDFRAAKEVWLYQSSGEKITVGGLSPLSYDYTLELVAMRRAAELAICYSHTRPNGLNCFSAFPDNSSYKKKGENVSAGIHTAEQTFNDWKEDGAANYDGQAHRRSMLSGEFNAVGISHVRFNGVDFWVQIFGQTNTPNSKATSADDNDALVQIAISNDKVEVSEIHIPTQVTMKQGETDSCPVANALIKLADTWPAMSFHASIYPSWVVDKSEIATISNGKITANDTGKGTLYTTVFGQGKAIPIRVVDENTIPIRDIAIVADRNTVQENNTIKLSVKYDPQNTTESPSVQWKSSNPVVATVSETGVVTGKTVGSAVITAFCENYMAEMKISVVEDPDAQCPSSRYSDLDKTMWYHEGVDYMLRNGYMQGTGQFSFEPYGTVTRGQVVTILYAMSGKPYVLRSSSFRDVSRLDWFGAPVAWAAANGIVAGYGDHRFGPNDNVTREQLVAILYKYTQFKKYDLTMKSTGLDKYPDCASISNYAMIPMLWAVSNDVISGTDRGLEPTASANRAQVAVMMKAYHEHVVEK